MPTSSPGSKPDNPYGLGRYTVGHPNKAQIFAFALQHGLIDTQALAISA
jgi:hypothetical protein